MTDPSPKSIVLPLLGITLLCWLLYYPAIQYGLTYFDDAQLTLDQKEYISELSNIGDSFFTDVFPTKIHNDIFYRPLLTISLIVDQAIGSGSLKVFHFSNVLYFLLACLAFFLGLFSITKKVAISTLLTLCLAANPIMTSTACWIPGRNDSILALFCIVSFLFLRRYLVKRDKLSLVLHSSFFVLALFSKENAIMLGPLCLFYYFLFHRKTITFQVLIPLLIIWLTSSLVFIYMRQLGLVSPPTLTFNIIENFTTNVYSLFHYVGKLVTTMNLSGIPIRPDMDNTVSLIGGGVLVLLMIFSQNRALSFFGLCWYLLFLIPGIIFTNPGLEFDFHFEHRAVTSLFGILMMLSATIINRPIARYVKYILPLLITFYLFRSYNYKDHFNDEAAFFKHAVYTSPHSSIAINGLANHFLKNGEKSKAINLLERAVVVNQNTIENYLNLAFLYFNTGNKVSADKVIEKALQTSVDEFLKSKTMGNYFLKTRDYERASTYINRAYELQPNDKYILRMKAQLTEHSGF